MTDERKELELLSSETRIATVSTVTLVTEAQVSVCSSIQGTGRGVHEGLRGKRISV